MKGQIPHLATFILAAAARLVPKHHRARWREEWSAELAHAEQVWRDQPHARLRLTRMAAGTIADATTVRTIAMGEWLRPGAIGRLVQGVGRDARLACRGLASSPGLALGIAGSLAIGLAANTAAFSVLQTMMFRPFPHVVDQQDLVRLCVGRGHVTYRNAAWCAASHDDYRQLRDHLDTVAVVSAYLPLSRLSVKLDDDHARTMRGVLVSSNYFEVLGVEPAAGRFFTARDDQSGWDQPVAVVSHAVWQRHLAGSPDALGRVMLVNGAAVQIIGVAPDTFVGVRKGHYDMGVWLPFALGDLALRSQEEQPVSASALGVSSEFDFIARVQPGVSIDVVEAQASAIAARSHLINSSRDTVVPRGHGSD